MAERRARLDTFLKHQGIDPGAAVLLAGDASNRRYFRTPGGVLMDAPPEFEDVRPFVRVARHLQDLGLSAPEILAEDVDDGWLLLEDLGDDLFSRVLATGAAPEPLYEMAVDVLVAITRHPPPQWLDPYDLRPLLAEAGLVPACRRRRTRPGVPRDVARRMGCRADPPSRCLAGPCAPGLPRRQPAVPP